MKKFENISGRSKELYKMLLSRGYQEEFCKLICLELNTEYLATRMIGYLYHYTELSPEEIADEMIAIVSESGR